MPESNDKQLNYESWVDLYSTELYRFAYRLAGRADAAEDLVQEAFFHAWRSYHTLRDHRRARAWLYQILRHRYSHWVRTDTRRPNLNTPLTAVADPTDHDAQAPLEALERSETLHNALASLDERYRLPFLLVFMQGLTCREAADELGVPLGTVLSRIHRARKALREHLHQTELDATPPSINTDQNPTPRLRYGGEA
ncbi:MAG: RNA polymerase sigma factor [Planctomycetota bacterium]|jgi:RNA polymerase sigma-70 factor (ECF subfamily)